MKYDFKKIESKWQKAWERAGLYRARDFDKKKKFYALVEFPYPSGEGLHTGHIRGYTAMDVIARKRRMEGHNVLYPMGWDAFGLPAENYAVKTGIHPRITTKRNSAIFRQQLKSLGYSFDWSREISTADPEYYKWTQWMFLQFFKRGLAYKGEAAINWCPRCRAALANEETEGGTCERCGGPVEQRMKKQWMLKMTAYAERLLQGLDRVDFPEEVKTAQRNWIGRSSGAEIQFPISNFQFPIPNSQFPIKVFTTRPDTLFGATYLVVAPEHELTRNNELGIMNYGEMKRYAEAAMRKTELERMAKSKEKTGVELKGIRAINPATKEEIPIFVAEYVLGSYGTGAIMAVPAHDKRDFEFAKKFTLPIREVVAAMAGDQISAGDSISRTAARVYEGEGALVNSGKFSGMKSEEARAKMTEEFGKPAIQYKMRDWIFSRQRYWGEPIPLICCETCGWVPVPEKDLPVKLPDVKNFKPREDGESPLASVTKWVNVKCPQCKGPAQRETDTMPTWAGSSWYYLAYCVRHNSQFTIHNSKLLKYWLPVDWYNGGMEHATRHLLYSRFWHMALYDAGVVPIEEPYMKRTSHGLILGAGGEKMSKSKGNVVNPDDYVKKYGADALRLYELFMGPFAQAIPWDDRGVAGTSRFLEKVWRIGTTATFPHSQECGNVAVRRLLHTTVKKVGEDIESMSFNTAVSAMMIFINALSECVADQRGPQQVQPINADDWKKFLRILAPFAPHISEELWQRLRGSARTFTRTHAEKSQRQLAAHSVHAAPWPSYDPRLAESETFELVIQVNGRTRDRVTAERGIKEDEAARRALGRPAVKKWIGATQPKRVVFVQNRLINFIL